MSENESHRTVQGGKPGEHGRTIPLYGMLDVWMALYGTSRPEFDEFYAEHGYAESWARLLAAVRERRTVQGEKPCRSCGRPMSQHPGGVYCPAGPVQGEPGLRAHVRNLTGATDAELDALGGFRGEPCDAEWIDDLETRAVAQQIAHARMVEIGEGVGGLGVRNRAMFEDMVAWQDSTENGHADTVLKLIAALRAAAEAGRER